jgi:hypothetical protein
VLLTNFKPGTLTDPVKLPEGGTPVLTPYLNDFSKVAAGKGRLTVRHDAATPAVDIRAGGTPVFKGLANPKEPRPTFRPGR